MNMTIGRSAVRGEDDRGAMSGLDRLLVCPVDKSALERDNERFVCPVCGRCYPIEEGIPNMLVGKYE